MAGVIFSLAACFSRTLLLLEDSSSLRSTVSHKNTSSIGEEGRSQRSPSKPISIGSQLLIPQKKTGSSSSSSSFSSLSSRGWSLRSVEVLRQLYSDVQYLTSLCRSLGFDPIADALTLARCSWQNASPLSSHVGERDSEIHETGEKTIEDRKRGEKQKKKGEGEGGEKKNASFLSFDFLEAFVFCRASFFGVISPFPFSV